MRASPGAAWLGGGRRGFELLFAVATAAAVLPLWWVDFPPIQDLPQHLAAIRVLHDYRTPALGFEQYFEIDLLRTQYVAYYLAADLLAYALDVGDANRVLLSACIIGLPYSLRSLQAALGGDPRLGLLALPLTYNAHLILGFLNFLSAIPLAFYGIALAVRQRRQPTAGRAGAIAIIGLVCFALHVVPFAFFALGAGLCALGRDLRGTARRLLPFLPSACYALGWSLWSPAGQSTLQAAAGQGARGKATYQPSEVALRELPAWMTDVLQGELDRKLLYAWLAVVAAALLLGLLSRLPQAPDRLGRSLRLRLWLLPPVAAAAYFTAPTSYDWIWPIAQRFPLLCALTLLPALPRLGPRGGNLVVACTLVLSALHLGLTGQAFARFEQREVGEFETVVTAIPPGQRVAGLIFSRGSREVRFSPFIHYVAYYQALRGGAVMFTFADFPHSPFTFVEGNRPPRVPPRWEWLPQRVRPDRDLAWYDYALVRGGPGAIARSRRFELVLQRGRWRVYKRVR